MKNKAATNISTRHTSEDGDIDLLGNEEDDDDDDDNSFLLHKTMADFGLNVNPFVSNEYLNSETKKPIKHYL